MGGRAGGGAGMGSRSRSGASGGGVDYLAAAGITMKDVMKVMKTQLTKHAPTPEQVLKKKIAQKKKAIEDEKAFNFLLGNIEAGLKAKKNGRF